MEKQTIGKLGENAAAEYLIQQGCFIVQRNYHAAGTGHEEIDVIAGDGRYLLFVEVKTRQKQQDFPAVLAVNRAKQKRLISCAQHFLLTHGSYTCYQPRFDVICVMLKNGRVERLEHYPNAFSICDL